MPCVSSNYSGPEWFLKNPDGSYEKIDPIHDVNIHLGSPNDYDRREPARGMSVSLSGSITYDQAKDFIGYCYSLWEKSNGQ